jgi:hypothetical protein
MEEWHKTQASMMTFHDVDGVNYPFSLAAFGSAALIGYRNPYGTFACARMDGTSSCYAPAGPVNGKASQPACFFPICGDSQAVAISGMSTVSTLGYFPRTCINCY